MQLNLILTGIEDQVVRKSPITVRASELHTIPLREIGGGNSHLPPSFLPSSGKIEVQEQQNWDLLSTTITPICALRGSRHKGTQLVRGRVKNWTHANWLDLTSEPQSYLINPLGTMMQVQSPGPEAKWNLPSFPSQKGHPSHPSGDRWFSRPFTALPSNPGGCTRKSKRSLF